MQADFYSRRESTLDLLAKIISEDAQGDGSRETEVKGLCLAVSRKPTDGHHCFSEPMALLVCQGQKEVNFGKGPILLGRGQLLVSCVESPNLSRLVEASENRPFIALHFLLDRMILAELLSAMHERFIDRSGMDCNASHPAAPEFLDTVLRLVLASRNPQSAAILGPLLLRELHYSLLAGPSGQCLKDLYMRGAKDSRIIDVITWLRNNLGRTVTIEYLAKKANMSVSSLHRHFKNVTGFSPLQYHKELRLLEAQRLMLANNERADIAALTVGYESVTQFNREYKRKFGLPPHRDILRIRSGIATTTDS